MFSENMVIEVKLISSHLTVCGCNAENNQNETAGGQENTLLFGFIARVVWGTALAPLPPIWNSSNSFLKRLTSNEHWSRVASTHFGGTTM